VRRLPLSDGNVRLRRAGDTENFVKPFFVFSSQRQVQTTGPNQVKYKWRATVAPLPHIDRWSNINNFLAVDQPVRRSDRHPDFLSFFLCHLIFRLFFFCCCFCFSSHADSLSERNGSRFYSFRDATAPCWVSAARPCLLQLSNPARLTESTSQSRTRSSNKCQSCSNLRYHRVSMSPMHLIAPEAS
jgi:hypothetical protein